MCWMIASNAADPSPPFLLWFSIACEICLEFSSTFVGRKGSHKSFRTFANYSMRLPCGATWTRPYGFREFLSHIPASTWASWYIISLWRLIYCIFNNPTKLEANLKFRGNKFLTSYEYGSQCWRIPFCLAPEILVEERKLVNIHMVQYLGKIWNLIKFKKH